ncbi:MAG: isochorismatase family protein [Candidatus Obscuribacterales bacterium]|nr:isochorismatase family protein [Candidatus Obscuribacterales bacterium]
MNNTDAQAKYVLVVIDMQYGFRASQSEAQIEAVAAEIEAAIELGRPIVVLEYKKYPATNERLIALLAGRYDKYAIAVKKDDDGSEELIDACIEHEFPGGHFRVCGVNTHWCVTSTVLGLAEKLDESLIEVVKAACNDEDGNDWEKFPKLANVVLV